MKSIEVQGHRGARGLLPENTLPSFEIALDLGVTSIETDVHMTRDDVVVLIHDARITNDAPLVRTLTLSQLRIWRIGIPTLTEFFEFVAEYMESISKTKTQQERASRLIFDLELKRMPFEPETIGDGFTGDGPALLERQVVAAIRAAGVLERTRVRSFDHRCVWAIKQLEPTLQTGLLIHETVPRDIAKLLETAQAELYCPNYRFVDAEVVRQVHTAKKRIIPYTVNEPSAWDRLIGWGVDGITTDYPDRLLGWLGERGMTAC